MFDLLLIPVSFFCVFAVYKYSENRAAKKAIALSSEVLDCGSESAHQVCVEIMDMTPTNNSYDPMRDALSDLDLDEVQTILGKALRTDIGRYMQ